MKENYCVYPMLSNYKCKADHSKQKFMPHGSLQSCLVSGSKTITCRFVQLLTSSSTENPLLHALRFAFDQKPLSHGRQLPILSIAKGNCRLYPVNSMFGKYGHALLLKTGLLKVKTGCTLI